MGDDHLRPEKIWRSLEKWFADGFPLPKFDHPKDWLTDPGQFEKAVQQTIRSWTNGLAGDEPSHDLSIKPGYILVKISLPDKTNPFALRAYVSAAKLQIEGLPGERQLSITLPEEVKAVGVRAVCKEGQLIVRMPRKKSGKGRQIGIIVK